MSNLVQNQGTFSYDNLFVGNDVAVLTQGVTLKQGVVAKRGAVIALDATSKGVLANKDNVSDKVVGILTDDVDATVKDTIATIYITGHVNADALIFDSGTTLADFELELRKLGIYTGKVQGGN